MKTMIIDNRWKTGNGRGRTATLLVGLALALSVPVTGLKAQVLDISNSVLLSWPESAQQQIVVGADSLASNAVWAPWPEPIFKRFGQMCVAVPTTASQQFFKTVLGTQFLDDFTDTQPPFTNRKPYTNIWAKPQHDVTVTNGILRVGAQGAMSFAGILLCPPSHPLTVRDFYSSVDILSWTTSNNIWSDFALVARGHYFTPSTGVFYMGGLILNRDNILGNMECRIYRSCNVYPYDRTYNHGSRFNIQTTPPPYRLEFSGVGSNLTMRVLSLPTKAVIQEMTVSDTTSAEGFVGLFVDMPDNNSGSHQVMADNYFVTGTKP